MLKIEDYEGEDYSIVRFSVEKEFSKLKKGVKYFRENWRCFGCLKIKKE